MLEKIIEKQKEIIEKNAFSIKERKGFLFLIKENIEKYEKEIEYALKLDLNKSEKESYISEIMIVKHELDFIYKNVEKMLKPKKVKTPIFMFPSKSYIYRKPYGNVLVISPWNYPFQLAIMPILSAITCGNTVVLKTSKKVPNTTNILRKIFKELIDENIVYICENESYDEILEKSFDFIFFTGSTKVGREILKKSADKLCPVVLELGGKSPVIIDETANLEITSRRLAFAKLLNSGQTCIAPDYVFIKKEIKEDFLKLFKIEFEKQYNLLIENDEFTKMISSEKVDSMKKIVQTDFEISDNFFDIKNRKIKPMILENANFSSKIMEDEIFAPILPFIEYENLIDVKNILDKKDVPLALYIFSNNKKNIDFLINNLKFGGATVNDCLTHIANLNLPFGGQKESGIGKYHGKTSIETFTIETSVVKSKFSFDTKFKYYPFSEKFLKLFKKLF